MSEVAAIAGVDAGEVIAVADQFRGPGRHMLMPPPRSPSRPQSRLDISHESLLRQWSSLVEWAREEGAGAREFDRLREEALLERDQEGELLSGRDLARALDWKRQADPTPAWAERYAPAGELEATLSFIAKSEAEARRRKNDELQAAKQAVAARRARLYTALSGGALVLASVVAIVIFSLWRQAGRDRDEAIRQTAVAEVHRRLADDQKAEATRLAAKARVNEDRANQASLEAETQRRRVFEQNTDLAKKESEAHISRLTANARLELARDVPLALLLAREAVLEGGSDPLAVRTLRDAIAVHVSSLERPGVAKARSYIPGSGKGAWLDFALAARSVSDQDLVITPSGNDAVIWSAANGRPVQVLKGHTGILASAVFSPNGRLAVTASADTTARLWETTKGRALQTFSHKQMVNAAVFNRDATLLVTLGDDELAQVWNINDGAVLRCRLQQPGNFITASFSEDQRLIATVRLKTWNTWQADVWDVSRPDCPRLSVPAIDNMKNLKWASFSDRGRFLGAVATDGVVIVLSVPEWKETLRYVPVIRYGSRDAHGPKETLPPPLAWSHDDRHVAAADGDNTIRIAPLTGDPRQFIELRGHTGRITSIAFGPADDMLLTTSADNTARIWTLGADKRVLERLILTGHTDTVGSGVFSIKGDRVVTASDDGTARSWKPSFALRDLIKVSDPADSRTLPPSRAPVTLGQIKGFLVSGEAAAALASRREEFTTRTGSSSFQPPRLIDRTASGFVVQDSTEAGSRHVLAWTGDRPELLPESSPGGRFLFAIVGKPMKSVRVWISRGSSQAQRVDPLSLDKASCRPEAIADDGRLAWYCADRDVVIVARPGQPALVKIHIADEARVESMRFSTAGRLLAMTLEDDSVRVFDTATGVGRPPMKGHDGWITGVDFSQDDRYLVSTSDDATARVWDVATGTQIAKTTTNVTNLLGAAFSRGRSLAVALFTRSPVALALLRLRRRDGAAGRGPPAEHHATAVRRREGPVRAQRLRGGRRTPWGVATCSSGADPAAVGRNLSCGRRAGVYNRLSAQPLPSGSVGSAQGRSRCRKQSTAVYREDR